MGLWKTTKNLRYWTDSKGILRTDFECTIHRHAKKFSVGHSGPEAMDFALNVLDKFIEPVLRDALYEEFTKEFVRFLIEGEGLIPIENIRTWISHTDTTGAKNEKKQEDVTEVIKAIKEITAHRLEGTPDKEWVTLRQLEIFTGKSVQHIFESLALAIGQGHHKIKTGFKVNAGPKVRIVNEDVNRVKLENEE